MMFNGWCLIWFIYYSNSRVVIADGCQICITEQAKKNVLPIIITIKSKLLVHNSFKVLSRQLQHVIRQNEAFKWQVNWFAIISKPRWCHPVHYSEHQGESVKSKICYLHEPQMFFTVSWGVTVVNDIN